MLVSGAHVGGTNGNERQLWSIIDTQTGVVEVKVSTWKYILFYAFNKLLFDLVLNFVLYMQLN